MKTITIYQSRFDNAGKQVLVKSVLKAVYDRRTCDEKDKAELVGFYKLKPNTTRGSDNVEEIYALGLDMDCGLYPEPVLKRFEKLQYLYYETHSHQISNPKYRIILPFSRAVSAEEYPYIWRFVVENILPENDPATKDPSRMFYLIAEKANAKLHQGELLPLDDIIEIEKRKEQKAQEERERATELRKLKAEMRGFGEEEAELEDVSKALERIDPDCEYNKWMRICFAIKQHFEDDGFDVFNDWSAKGHKYGGLDATAEYYRRAEPNGSISINTLFFLSRKDQNEDFINDESK